MEIEATSRSTSWLRHYFHVGSWPFWGVHVTAIVGIVLSGWSWAGFALAMAFYAGRMFFVSAGYHRYFSHRSFKTSRVGQFLFALGATLSAQKGVLWWAGHHRRHHKYSDQEGDVHSALLRGFWFSHVGWVAERNPEREIIDRNRVKDLWAFRELRILEHVNLIPPIALAVILFFVGGWHTLLWGFFVSTVLLWHGTFTVNSLNHLIGRRRYPTTDQSRNNWFLAIFVTLGEGWHNNHHHYMGSVNQGFRWYEIDVTYYVLRVMSWFGLVWDLKVAPPHIVRGAPRRAPIQARTAAGPSPAAPAAHAPERR